MVMMVCEIYIILLTRNMYFQTCPAPHLPHPYKIREQQGFPDFSNLQGSLFIFNYHVSFWFFLQSFLQYFIGVLSRAWVKVGYGKLSYPKIVNLFLVSSCGFSGFSLVPADFFYCSFMTIRILLVHLGLLRALLVLPGLYSFCLRIMFWRPSSPLLGFYSIIHYCIHFNTWMVTHPSANHGTICFTSVILRELVFPTWYIAVILVSKVHPTVTLSSSRFIWLYFYFFPVFLISLSSFRLIWLLTSSFRFIRLLLFLSSLYDSPSSFRFIWLLLVPSGSSGLLYFFPVFLVLQCWSDLFSFPKGSSGYS